MEQAAAWAAQEKIAYSRVCLWKKENDQKQLVRLTKFQQVY